MIGIFPPFSPSTDLKYITIYLYFSLGPSRLSGAVKYSPAFNPFSIPPFFCRTFPIVEGTFAIADRLVSTIHFYEIEEARSSDIYGAVPFFRRSSSSYTFPGFEKIRDAVLPCTSELPFRRFGCCRVWTLHLLSWEQSIPSQISPPQ